jgi:DNA-binding PadR family transcriptional regulator
MTPIDFNGLDTVVHGPVRLGTMTALRIDRELDFTSLKKRLQVTDGSLGIHLQKLEEIDYIRSKKTFVKRRPKTTYRLTIRGKRALAKYLESMQKLLDAVDEAAR